MCTALDTPSVSRLAHALVFLTINGIELYVPQGFRNTIVSLFENISLIGFPLFPRNEKIPTRQSLSRLESGAAGPTGRSKSD